MRSRWQTWIPAGAVAAPFVFVAIAREVMYTPVTQSAWASAGPAAGHPLLAHTPRGALGGPVLSEGARAYLVRMAEMGSWNSPMLHPERPTDVTAEPAFAPDSPQQAAPGKPVYSASGLRVTAVMGTGSRASASINGRIARVGDVAGDRATIVAIDPETGIVRVRFPDGSEAQIGPQGPIGGTP